MGHGRRLSPGRQRPWGAARRYRPPDLHPLRPPWRRLHPPGCTHLTPIYRRGGVVTRPRWRAFWYLRRARRRQLPCPRPPPPQAKATSRGAVAAPAAEQSRIRATATRGKIGRTRPLTGSETASADPTAPPLTRAWPAGRGAAWRSVGKISSSPCAHQDSTSGGSAHATAARTASCVADGRDGCGPTPSAAGDADRRPGCAGGPNARPRPPLRGQRALPSLEEAGTADLGSSYRSASAADTDLTVPDFVYFDPSDESSVVSNRDSSADAERLVWQEDVKG